MPTPNRPAALPRGVRSADEPLSLHDLAEAVGPRRAGRPTNVETVRAWCLQGVEGVRMESWLEVCVRMSSWGAYLRFREGVERAKAEKRERRKQLRLASGLREQKKRQKRAEAARRELEALGAR